MKAFKCWMPFFCNHPFSISSRMSIWVKKVDLCPWRRFELEACEYHLMCLSAEMLHFHRVSYFSPAPIISLCQVFSWLLFWKKKNPFHVLRSSYRTLDHVKVLSPSVSKNSTLWTRIINYFCFHPLKLWLVCTKFSK